MTEYKHDTKTQSDRNIEILRLREEEKWSYRKIGDFFGISRSRAEQICKREHAKRNARKPIIKNSPNFYLACIKAAQELGIDEKQATRVYNCLVRARITPKLTSGQHNLKRYSDEDLLCIRNFGVNSLKIARLADEIF